MSSHWTYNGVEFDDPPDGAYGFVYRITNTQTGRMYVGRKYFNSTRRVKRVGKLRRTVKVTESKWRTYTGSSNQLNADISEIGIQAFKFEILAIGYTVGQVNYLEENIQHKLDVVVGDRYYNDAIGSNRFRNLKTDKNFKVLLESIDIA